MLQGTPAKQYWRTRHYAPVKKGSSEVRMQVDQCFQDFNGGHFTRNTLYQIATAKAPPGQIKASMLA
jgi:hypothetical protein